ncbi:trypsin-like cysteine/serine peptidase domain-containing protein [Syncephalis fuscata]|nr:trypsin-like cysteine/serine peptidase domain-containing protein [Syncephalis fuscata]
MFSFACWFKPPMLLSLLLVKDVLLGGLPSAASTPSVIQYKIAGGKGVKITQYPFAANIHINNSSSCGGTIISDRWILTAAHCLVNIGASKQAQKSISYKLESLSLNLGSTQSASPTPIPAKQAIWHHNYSYAGQRFDAGLIELATPLIFSDTIQPIKLSQDDGYFDDNQMYRVIGWGRDEQRRKSLYLKEVDIPGTSTKECSKGYPEYLQHRDELLCAGFTPGKDTCEGDSGGPLLLEVASSENTTGKVAAESWLQVGVTSFGINNINETITVCGAPGSVGYYGRSDFLTPWIANITGLDASLFTAPLPDVFVANKTNAAGNSTNGAMSANTDTANFLKVGLHLFICLIATTLV